MRTRLLLVSLLVVSCFQDADQIEGTTAGTAGTEGTAGTGVDTGTGGGNPVDVCRVCQMEQCSDYAAACAADGECDACVAAPFDLACLANENMHALGTCSCDACPTECDYLCPGGVGVCNACGIDQCGPEGSACIADPECAPCLEDPFREGCAENVNFMAADACNCANCGEECVWQCPEAGNACGSCVSSACADPFNTCITNETCSDCFASPYLEGCADDMAFQALMVCGCGNCSDTCGLLFECGG